MTKFSVTSIIITILFLLPMTVKGQKTADDFKKYFCDSTLRVDYVFIGNKSKTDAVVEELNRLPGWAGRRHHLSDLPLRGNGIIKLRDAVSKEILYQNSFSSLYQEWLHTEAAKGAKRSFENVFLLPYPKRPADIEILLYQANGDTLSYSSFPFDPNDILIHHRGEGKTLPHEYLHHGGSPETCIDVAILGEGYTKAQMPKLRRDAKIAVESILSYEPFKQYKDKFNFILVESVSEDSTLSVPRKGLWTNTAFGSHFDTFYSDRYLTSRRCKAIHNALDGIPYEHIIVLANTNVYGGGGIYNAYTLTASGHSLYRPVVVHEFGHSFGGLADEYYYKNDQASDSYVLSVEPWEKNVTTLVNFTGKWENMIPDSCPRPTPIDSAKQYPIGLYEGGAYSFKGIYRCAPDCRMKTNTAKSFCPACQKALRELIQFYTK